MPTSALEPTREACQLCLGASAVDTWITVQTSKIQQIWNLKIKRLLLVTMLKRLLVVTCWRVLVFISLSISIYVIAQTTQQQTRSNKTYSTQDTKYKHNTCNVKFDNTPGQARRQATSSDKHTMAKKYATNCVLGRLGIARSKVLFPLNHTI